MIGFRSSVAVQRSAKRASDMGSAGANPHAGRAAKIDALLADALPGHGVAGNASGVIAGTRIATSIGWRMVEMIAPGDRVLTFDNGMQEVTHVVHSLLWSSDAPCPRALWPLHVPAGVLGNAQAIVMLPEQSVVVESDVGEEIYGDPFTLIPAAALEGFRGIERRAPEVPTLVITLHFAEDEVVFASGGALFFCPSDAVASLSDLLSDGTGRYSALSEEDARFLLDCVDLHERRNGLWPFGAEVRAA
jgi:hypothetical protein